MTSPLRVAVVAACPFPARRGTPARIFRLSEALAARGHDVHVVTYHLGDEASAPFTIHRTAPMASYQKVAPGPSYTKLFILDPRLARLLRSVVAQHDIDVVHAHHYEGLLVARSLRRRERPPLIFDCHTLLESELPFHRMLLPGPVKRTIGRTLDRLAPRSADHVIALTERMQGQLVSTCRVPRQKISIVPNGVEIDFFANPPHGTREHPRKDVAHSPANTLIFTGNLASYQGFDKLLKAFALVHRQRPEVGLRVVTDSSFEPYEQLARESGVRQAIECVAANFNELPDELAHAAIALNPRTDCDGIPQKLLNYMAAGKPTVSFAGSAPFVRDRETGWIVENDDVRAFAEAIVTLLNDPALAETIGQNAQAHVRSEHTWERAAQRTEAVYELLLERTAHNATGFSGVSE